MVKRSKKRMGGIQKAMSDIHKPEEFENLYQSGGWSGKGSGPGSSELFTREFRKVFEKLMVDLKIKSVFDLGCGDWQWQRHVKWPEGIKYRGWDASETAIEKAASNVPVDGDFRFHVVLSGRDAFQVPIWPETDLLLVKDVVHHLSKFRVRQLIEKAKPYDYVLWVVDTEGPSDGYINHPCNWPICNPLRGEEIFRFDLKVEGYPYGPKSAILQINP